MSPRRRADKRLPSETSQLRGRRAARWTRESTGKADGESGQPSGGQWDAFGPEAQRAHQDEAIHRLGLMDVTVGDPSLDFKVAHSGRTVADTAEFREMLARAGADFDVLVVGYVSRFARDARDSFNARHDMHAQGAVIYFADDRILTSDERRWKEWADETVEAEAFSRKHGRRVKEGLEAKRLRLGEPGGRPPFGFRRDGGKPSLLVEDPEKMALLRRVFELAASGLTDREVAERTDLKKKHVAELLPNPIYVGVVDGETRRPAVINRDIWERVQANRARHARRVPGPTRRRHYLLSGLLHCRACGHSLTGHVGRYRHEDGCATFRAARTEAFWDRRGKGDSYMTEVYDPIVPRALKHISANAQLVAEVTDAVVILPAPVNEMALQRIKRHRQEAADKVLGDRDYVALKATMDALDAEEAEVRATVEAPITPSEVADALSDMRRLFSKAEHRTQQRIAQALLKKVEG